jgi:hypothetical protein
MVTFQISSCIPFPSRFAGKGAFLMKTLKLTLTFNPNILWRKKMKYLLLILTFWLIPILSLAQMVVDGNLDDWIGQDCIAPTDNSCDLRAENSCFPFSVDIRKFGLCIDYKHDNPADKELFMFIKTAENGREKGVFSGADTTCYEFYLDSVKDTSLGCNDTYWQGKVTGGRHFKPDFRIQVCGSNNQVNSERFLVWNSNNWIGEDVQDHPLINEAISIDFQIIEIDFSNLDTLEFINPRRVFEVDRMIPFSAIAQQNDAFDITEYVATLAIDEHDLKSIISTTWKDIKTNSIIGVQ